MRTPKISDPSTYYTEFDVEDTRVGIDWMTITANTTDRKRSILMRYLRLEEALRLMGETRKTWKWRGYEGAMIGGIRWGTRADSDILILSGQDAQSFWRTMAPLSTNCSRVDLAVTCRTHKCYPRLLHAYKAWLNVNGSGLARRCTTIERVDGIGMTLNVGQRTADQCGRVYDKGAEQNLPLDTHRLWRYEVEFKGDRAKSVLAQLISETGREEFPSNICSTVHTWFDQRDVPPVFQKHGQALTLNLQATVTSTSQKLAWLSKQVRPAVKSLSEQGYLEEVLAALGLG
jgi:DNA relaxase NicK